MQQAWVARAAGAAVGATTRTRCRGIAKAADVGGGYRATGRRVRGCWGQEQRTQARWPCGGLSFAEGTAQANGCLRGQGHLPALAATSGLVDPSPAGAQCGEGNDGVAGPECSWTPCKRGDPGAVRGSGWGGLARMFLAGLGRCVIPRGGEGQGFKRALVPGRKQRDCGHLPGEPVLRPPWAGRRGRMERSLAGSRGAVPGGGSRRTEALAQVLGMRGMRHCQRPPVWLGCGQVPGWDSGRRVRAIQCCGVLGTASPRGGAQQENGGP